MSHTMKMWERVIDSPLREQVQETARKEKKRKAKKEVHGCGERGHGGGRGSGRRR